MTCQGMGVRSSRSNAVDSNNAAAGGDMAAMSSVWGDWMSEEMTGATASTSTAATTKSKETPAATTAGAPTTGPRTYLLPVTPPQSKPGILLQTGTLDSTIPGRSSIPKVPRVLDLECPTRLFTNTLGDVKFVKVVTSATACHSVGITKG